MTTDSGLRDIKIFPEELGKIFEQAYKDLPGVSRGAIHSLVLRGVKYATTTPCANCERLQKELDDADYGEVALKYFKQIVALTNQLQTANANLEMCRSALDEIQHITLSGLKQDAAEGIEPRDWKYYASLALAKLEKE